MIVVIKVQYFGVLRLLLTKKEDIFEFPVVPTLMDLVQSIGRRYGKEILKECIKQAFYLQLSGDELFKQVRLLGGQDLYIKDGSIVRIVSMITGG